VAVVVPDVVDHEVFELWLVPGDGGVEEFAGDGGDPAFIESVGDRGSDGVLEDLVAFGVDNLVEGIDELGDC